MNKVGAVLWVLCGIIGYGIGKSKGLGFSGAIWGLFLGPIGLVIVANQEGFKKCAFCKADIPSKAMVCPDCKSEQEGPSKA